MSGAINAIATAPLNKEAMHMVNHITLLFIIQAQTIQAGFKYGGHTELLAKFSGSTTSRLCLTSDKLTVCCQYETVSAHAGAGISRHLPHPFQEDPQSNGRSWSSTCTLQEPHRSTAGRILTTIKLTRDFLRLLPRFAGTEVPSAQHYHIQRAAKTCHCWLEPALRANFR